MDSYSLNLDNNKWIVSFGFLQYDGINSGVTSYNFQIHGITVFVSLKIVYVVANSEGPG